MNNRISSHLEKEFQVMSATNHWFSSRGGATASTPFSFRSGAKPKYNIEKTWTRIFMNLLHSLLYNTFEMSKFHFPEECGFDYTAIRVLNNFICDWMLVCDFISSFTDGALDRQSQFSNFLKQTITYKILIQFTVQLKCWVIPSDLTTCLMWFCCAWEYFHSFTAFFVENTFGKYH